jgi:hypothetical protein
MAITVKHSKVSTIPDGDDSSVVRPSDWNADHQLVGTIPVDNGGTGASTLTGYVKGNGTSAMTASATVPSTDVTGLGTMSTQNANNVAITGGTMSGVAITGYIPTTEKAQPLGVATLDAGGKVPQSQIPLMGDLNYQGTWNASTNTPTLTSSVGTKGYYYVVDVAGTTNLNGITDWQIGDWAIFNGSIWQKVDNTDAVTSVNGQVGTVVLTTTNISEGTNLYYTDVRARASNSAGTGISYDNSTGVITNSAPDQTVALTGGTGISTSGTYPNFTITNTLPSLGGDVVGPGSATDNAIARYDTTTGKLLQNSLVIIDDTGSVTGVNALTAQSLTVNNNATLGSSNTDTLEVNSRITTDLEPNANNAKDIGTSGINWRDGFFGRTLSTVNIEVNGTTSFDGSQGTSGQVLTSAGTGNTPTWTTPTVGTVTSVAATVPSFLSVSGSPITTSGTLALTYSGTALPIANGGTGATVANGAMANLMGFTSTATAGGTTTLTNTSSYYQLFTGTLAQTVVLPVTSTLQQGWTFHICNNSTGNLTVNTSGGNNLATFPSGLTVMVTCIATGGTGVADWEFGYTDFSTRTGQGSVVLNSSPTIEGAMNFRGSTTSNSNFGSSITSGTIDIGGTSGTGTLTVGQSTVSQTTNIQAGATASGSTKTINIGSGGLAGSTTAIAIGSTAGTSTTTVNGTLNTPVINATNGIVVNSNTVSASYTIPTGSSAMSAGPMTVASGQTVTVSSGSRWVVL